MQAWETWKAWKGTAIFLSFAVLGSVLILVGMLWQGDKNTLPWPVAVEHFGITLLAVVCAAVAFDLFLKDQLIKDSGATVTAAMITALRSYETMGMSGIDKIHRSLNDTPLVDNFQKSRKEIRLLQTWVGNLTGLLASLELAANERCKIRILVLNPESFQATARSRDFGEEDDFAAKEIKGSIRLLERLFATCKKNLITVGGDAGQVMVRLYDATPIFTIYAGDNVAYVGFYWRKQAAMLMPQIELREAGYLAIAIDKYFEDLWMNEGNIRLEDWKEAPLYGVRQK